MDEPDVEHCEPHFLPKPCRRCRQVAADMKAEIEWEERQLTRKGVHHGIGHE